jgi:hypothetical protein
VVEIRINGNTYGKARKIGYSPQSINMRTERYRDDEFDKGNFQNGKNRGEENHKSGDVFYASDKLSC